MPTATAPAVGLRASSESPAVRNPELWSACQEFEALLLQQMLRAMSGTLTSGGMFGTAAGSGIYQELFESELAQSMSRTGGVGLAQILFKQMNREI